jgi:hypothetical protein
MNRGIRGPIRSAPELCLCGVRLAEGSTRVLCWCPRRGHPTVAGEPSQFMGRDEPKSSEAGYRPLAQREERAEGALLAVRRGASASFGWGTGRGTPMSSAVCGSSRGAPGPFEGNAT